MITTHSTKESKVASISIDTVMCGTVKIDDSKILHFEESLLGFEGKHQFTLIQTAHGPMFWLQCIDDPSLAFCVLEPFEAGLDPDMALMESDLQSIGVEKLEDVKVYTIVVLDEDPAKIRTNLRAPILISTTTNKGKQVIIDDQNLPVQLFLKDLATKETA